MIIEDLNPDGSTKINVNFDGGVFDFRRAADGKGSRIQNSTVTRWQEAIDQWQAVQLELATIYEKAQADRYKTTEETPAV